MDIRMPPGADGVATTTRLLRDDGEVQIVLCTAYSDYEWEDFIEAFGETDRVLILKKPFDVVEVRQLASSLSKKWLLGRRASHRMEDLEGMVRARTAELEAANAKLIGEMSERERIEVELRHSQKLEAVGQLAAGIAHEINTPMQYVGNNTDFLRRAFETLRELCARRAEACAVLSRIPGHDELVQELKEAEKIADITYLAEEVPSAFDETFAGIARISTIVKAMKEFSHPDQSEKHPADLNQALQTTLTVARSEYKYVAEVETDLGDIPLVVCHLGDLNQVFLNLVVNAAHAISDSREDGGALGCIRVRTRVEGDVVVIALEDTGRGIPEGIRHRVFDPFFTTKKVGRGTGQGLTIARSIVVDRHGGTLTCESEEDRGTIFRIRLPVDGTARLDPA